MSLRHATPSLPPWSPPPALVAALLFAAVALAWANTWNAPFVFDDVSSILENRSLRDLASLSWLNPPHAAGETVGGRPVLNFTFALNYAISGSNVWSYHGLNGLIHFLAALALWAVLRRLPPIGSGVALATTLLWAVHPLQTAAVTYVAQRAESLAALFVLLTLYGFLRYAGAESRRRRWAVLSVLACLAGVGTKETAAVAPLLVMLIGGTVFAASFRETWRKYGGFYAALGSTWGLLGILVWSNHGRGGSAGFGSGVDVFTYALTQVWAVPHYLRLMLWPAGQTFDYGMVVVTEPAAALVPAVVLFVLLAVTAWALWRRHVAGVAGACFFLLLAPSSSFVPVATQTIAEHRVYLALAVPLVLLCAAVARLRWPAVLSVSLTGVAAGGLGFATHLRNEVYRSPRELWADTVAHRPENPRAHYNLGLAWVAEGRREEAVGEFEQAVALQPTHAFAQFQLGVHAMTAGDWPAAQTRFAAALEADPHYVDARVNLAQVLARLGRTEEAVAHDRIALAEAPAADVRTHLAGLLLQLGHIAEATGLLEQALAEAPEFPEAHYHWARLRERAGDSTAAENELRIALHLRPAFPAAAMALGNLLARQGRFAEAIDAFRAALATEPGNHQARNNLANCYLALRRFPEAIAEYEQVLTARPNDASVLANLEIARSMRGQP